VLKIFITGVLAASLTSAMALANDRARDLGVEFEGTPGKFNAITDVPGVELGHVTLIEGDRRTQVGQGPVRTGVTAVLPRGHASPKPVNGGFFNLNGYGEMTGQSYLQDLGLVYGPIGISNTNAIGQVYAGIQRWTAEKFGEASTPVVAETWDGGINDIQGFHVTPEHAMEAIEQAKGGPVAEGNVGGGTGMRCFGFKGGIGTASRTISIDKKPYVVGVLVQCNTGARDVLRISGFPVGQELNARWLPCYAPGQSAQKKEPECQADGTGGKPVPDDGSIIVVVATDVPLSSMVLNRVARRASLGIGRLGSFSGNGSGDLVVSFSTTSAANDVPDEQLKEGPMVATGQLDPVFQATVEATEEAIVNALVAARTMTGADGYTLFGLPHEELKKILGRYGRQQAK
jgi:L-aminopeptidase/D-esterase-like protein